MTIKELKEAIANLPDNMEVFMTGNSSEFDYGLVNSARVEEIRFCEEDADSVLEAFLPVLILDEE